MDKNIVITRSNPVKPDSRVEKEALSLYKAGYNVKVLCWDRDSSHPEKEEFLEFGDIKIPVIRLGFKASFGDGMKNIIPYLKFQFAMRKWIRKHKNEISLLHACDFDTAFFTYRLAHRKKIKVVFDIFDFIGSDRKTFFQRVLSKLQYDIIKRSDATIICTEERKKQIEGSTPQKLTVIHNTPSEAQLVQNLAQHPSDNGKIRVCYVGILQPGRLLEEIGEYFSENHEVEFHIGGFGFLETYFKELSAANDNIKYYGRLSYDKTLALENDCDIMLAIYDPRLDNHIFAAPNKFYESLFLGKPVIMVKGTGMSSVIDNNDVGCLIDYSKESFASGIDSLIARKDEWTAMSAKSKELYREKYNWTVMEKRLVDLYKSLLG